MLDNTDADNVSIPEAGAEAVLPGINAPIAFDPPPTPPVEPMPVPVAPTPPPAESTEEELMRYAAEVRKYDHVMQLYSNELRRLEETQQAILRNIGG